jgi:hypothetical protein
VTANLVRVPGGLGRLRARDQVLRALRRLIGLVTLVAVAAGAAVILRRRVGGSRERADLYFEDGSMASFEAGSPDADRMLGFARDALAAARTG